MCGGAWGDNENVMKAKFSIKVPSAKCCVNTVKGVQVATKALSPG